MKTLLVAIKCKHVSALASFFFISQFTQNLEAVCMLQCNLFKLLVLAWGETENYFRDKTVGYPHSPLVKKFLWKG